MTSQQKDILISKMFDSPQSLTSEDIEVIMDDGELLELYQTAVLYKDSKPSKLSYDMDKEWASMSKRLGLDSEAETDFDFDSNVDGDTESSLPPISFWNRPQWRKYAAIIALCLSITAIAAITTHYVVNLNRDLVKEDTIETPTTESNTSIAIVEETTEEPANTVLQSDKVFEGATLQDIAQELSIAFGTNIEVEDQVKDVRLYLNLPQGSTIEDLLTVLGQYDTLSVSRDGDGNILIEHGE